MLKKWQPTWYSKSIHTIDFARLRKKRIKNILLDLDNTVVPYNVLVASEIEKYFFEYLKDLGFSITIISNNNEERVSTFCSKLNIPYVYSSKKPLSRKTKQYLKENHLLTDETVLIGDQIITDIWLANNLKVKSILVEPIQVKEAKITFLNRKLDKCIRKRLKKKGRLVSIERR